MKEFILIQDDDSHWYVIPADKLQEAMDYFSETAEFWEPGNSKGMPPSAPKWLEQVGGSPSLVKFRKYRIEE